MRAVAVGMSTTEGLPRCPQDCGGPLGGQYPHLLTNEQKALRERWGCDCDAAQPQYTITCPTCDGCGITVEGQKCPDCIQHGRMKGQKKIRRCPSSHIDVEISDAMKHYPHAEGGMFPVDGGLLEQSPSYLHFVSTLKCESARVTNEETDERKASAKAKNSR